MIMMTIMIIIMSIRTLGTHTGALGCAIKIGMSYHRLKNRHKINHRWANVVDNCGHSHSRKTAKCIAFSRPDTEKSDKIFRFSKNAGRLISRDAGHIIKMRDCLAGCGTVDDSFERRLTNARSGVVAQSVL